MRRAALLPSHLLSSPAAHDEALALPHAERFPAALLIADISGFTALTERLQERGREGAERIAAIVSGAFGPAIEAIGRHGGSIVSFAGDALLAIFPGPRPVHRAQAAAEIVRSRGADRALAREAGAPIAIAQAIHLGEVSGLHLGLADRRRYVVTGRAVTELLRLEARVAGGVIGMSPAARRALALEKQGAKPDPVRALSTERVVRRYLAPELGRLLRGFRGEFRHVTMLFVEVRPSDAARLQAFHAKLVEALACFDGLLLKADPSAHGTRWLCTFGIPRAHEGDPERAGRVALQLEKELPAGLRMRAGLHGGVVANIVIGSPRRGSFDVMGDAVNTAARALERAAWGEVLATDRARRRLATLATEPRGGHRVKGKARPLVLHALVGERRRAESRGSVTPLVDRVEVLARCGVLLDRVSAAGGGAVALRGELGVGKTRVLWELKRRARERGFQVRDARASAIGGGPYALVRQLLRAEMPAAGQVPVGSVAAAAESVAGRLRLPVWCAAHIADAFGERVGNGALSELPAAIVRRNNALAICHFVTARFARDRLLLVVDDMQWADELSREVIDGLVRATARTPCALLLAYRPEEARPEGLDEIELEALPERDARAMLDGLLAGAAGPVRERAQRLAQGNPLFIEELARHVRHGASSEVVPDAVEGLVRARIDRLPAGARRAVQVASVVGGDVRPRLLARMGLAGAQAALARLVALDVLVNDGRGYAFRHALVREVAYGSILGAERRRLHLAAARSLSSEGAAHALLAHHYDLAGEMRRASRHELRAARQAAAVGAHGEAVDHFERCLARTPVAPPEVRRGLAESLVRFGRVDEAAAVLRRAVADANVAGDDVERAEAFIALGDCVWEGGDPSAARRSYGQASAIARRAGEALHEARAQHALARLSADAGDLDRARLGFERARRVYERAGDLPGMGGALGNLASVEAIRGNATKARELFERALRIHRSAGSRVGEASVLFNQAGALLEDGRAADALEVFGLSLAIQRELGNLSGIAESESGMANALSLVGRVEESVALYLQALATQREIRDRSSEGVTLGNLASVELTRGRPHLARRRARAALAIHRELGQPLYEAYARVTLADVAIELGRPDDARAELRTARRLGRELGSQQVMRFARRVARKAAARR